MTTIREVAKKAGVSFTTVSHVINETRFVSADTRSRVLTAMAELNYRPNALARSLRKGKTFTIGLILPDSSNPFFAEIGRSVEAEAFKLGFNIILCNTERDLQREKIYVDVLTGKQVDGIIFVATGDQIDSLNFLLGQEIPVVLVDRDLPGIEIDAVLTDNTLGGYLATQHLIALGHRRIACITGPAMIATSADRTNGYRRALEEAGIGLDPSLILRGDYQPASGSRAGYELLRRPLPPTAVFALNDLMALGFLHAAVQSGRRVPADLSIIGYDDIELATFTNPPLTTIAQPKTEIGLQAATLLADRIAENNCPARRVLLPPHLILRGSTAPNPSESGQESLLAAAQREGAH